LGTDEMADSSQIYSKDIFGLNSTPGGSSSVSCLKADVTVFYRMWRNITVAAILMLLTGVEAEHSVTLSSQSLCAVTGSTVKIPCTFTTPDHSSVPQREWYRVQSSEGEPRDLSTDPQYSGRVSVSTVTSDCELTVRNVRVSDSGVYNFRFKTQRRDWISNSSGFNLTVTALLFQDPVVCRFNGNDQCYLVLGEQLNLQMPLEDGFELKITDKTSTTRLILKYRKTQSNPPTPSIPRWQFINENKTLILLSAERSDSGTYTLETYDADGRSKGIYTLQVNTEDLKVTVSDGRNGNKKLICKTTCTLSNNPTYIWYKNGQRVTEQDRNDEYLDVSSGDAGSYTCAVRGHEDLRSPGVCVFNKSCWSVTYSTQTICSLIGSSVDIHSYYTFPDRYKVTKVLWFIKVQADGEPVDVREDEEYQGRVQYTQSSQNNCSLRITNLTERDTQTYRFRFYTDGGDYTGEPGVSLSVPDLKVTVSDWRDQNMTLSCITTCTLSNTPTYIWYKNGQRVSDCKSASCSVAAVSGAVSYSCAVEGHDSLLSPPVYPPKNTSAVVLSSGNTMEGDLVTLSCSSDANPPVQNYSWFKQRAAADTLLTTGQNYSISNISSQHSGLYYCTAHNQLGQHNSTPTELDVFYSPKHIRAVVLSSGDTVEGDSVTLSCSSDANPPVQNYSWFKQRSAADTLLTTGQNYSISNISSQHSGLYYCTAHNQLGQHNSTPTLLDVLYPPKNTRAVVLSSGDTVEGDSVTLSCSSDANPPVLTYSWFKQRAAADTLLTTGQNYSISNISSQHSGLYYCTAHNHLGQHNSTPTELDVLYSPKNTRAVVLSSGDTVEGDSVTLSCSSDANPPVLNYSWFKQRAAADTLLTTGQNYSISNISSQHSGLYYCTAHNQLGQQDSTPTLLDVLVSVGSEENTVLKLVMVGLGVFLALTLISGSLWLWKRKSSLANSTGESEQPPTDAMYESVPASDCRGRVDSDDQDNLQYASVVFKKSPTQEGSLSPRLPPDNTEEEEVQYAIVNFRRSAAATQLGTDEMADDPSQIYSK
ncbi:B-cell receptor CD22-like, partial [Clarias magur]